ncbi:MAG: hypothetical protein Q9193_004816 [Seirophora villosa]
MQLGGGLRIRKDMEARAHVVDEEALYLLTSADEEDVPDPRVCSVKLVLVKDIDVIDASSKDPTFGASTHLFSLFRQIYQTLCQPAVKSPSLKSCPGTDNVKQFSGKYSFLTNFTYSLGADQLTVFGERQMIHSGMTFYGRYKKLATQSIPFIRASGEARVVQSAQNFSQGFHDAKSTDHIVDANYPYPILVIPEGNAFNNTLDHGLCTAFEGSQPYQSIGSNAQRTFLGTFLPTITERLNADLSPANLSTTDTINIMDLCPFTTVASPIGATSSFCGLFTDDEWHHYDYYQTLGKYYGYGPGNPLGPSQGIGFANELVARMTGRPVDDHTAVNHTLDNNAATFPLDNALYVDVSHDNDMTAIFSAMGLYNGTGDLCNTSIETTRQTGGYSAAWTVPFAGRAYFEKMKCRGEKEELVRIIVNDRVLSLKTCGGDDLGRCTLSKFVRSLSFAAEGGNWDMCFTI